MAQNSWNDLPSFQEFSFNQLNGPLAKCQRAVFVNKTFSEGIALSRPSRNYPRSKLLSGLPTSLQLFTVTEVAIILDVDINLVNKWINNGLLPSLQLGKEKFFTRIRAQDLEIFIDTQIRVGNIKLIKK